jgi:prophage DNA circulation protein
MSWQDRTAAFISMTSPGGILFEPLWKNNDIQVSKKLGIFEFPGIKGARTQDLDVGGDRYPITVFFEGEDHDLESQQFSNALKENGPWEIIHPTKGRKTLQLIEWTEKIDPTENGNITSFSTSWIEFTDFSAVVSISQIASDVDAAGEDLNESSAVQFEEITSQEKPSFVAAIKTTTEKVITSFNENVQGLSRLAADINSQVISVQRGITDTISQTTINVLSLAGQIQTMIQLPGMIITDIETRLSAYGSMIESVLGIDSDGPTTQEGINKTAVKELTLTAVIVALGEISVSSDLTTRSESINTIESISKSLADITVALDTDQELYVDNDIDIQYFSQSSSYPDSLEVIYQSARYLLEQTFSLAIEKRITITNDSSPIIVAIKEYGELGDNDSNFDLFISSNQLKGSDILLLKSGTEVVVYV